MWTSGAAALVCGTHVVITLAPLDGRFASFAMLRLFTKATVLLPRAERSTQSRSLRPSRPGRRKRHALHFMVDTLAFIR